MNELNCMNLTISCMDYKLNETSKTLKTTIFNKNNNESLLNVVLKTDIGEKFKEKTLCYFGINQIKVFIDFTKRHKSTNFKNIFEYKKNKTNDYFTKYRKVKGQKVHHYVENKKCENQVHPSQIRECFQVILYKVVTKELIGNGRNKKKILKNFFNFLQIAKTEPFMLHKLVRQINVSSINWLNTFRDEQIKYILLAKFLKCLFLYFIVLIHNEFHVTFVKGEQVFIHKKDWNKQKKIFLKKMQNKMALEPVSQVIDKNEIRKNLFLIPKQDGIRCITRQMYKDDEQQNLRKVLSILTYLYNTYLKKDSDFSNKYIDFIKEKNNFENKRILIIASDIQDAYGSIRPAKLYDIIKSLINKLPNVIKLQWFVVRKSKKYKVVDNSNLIKSKSVKNKIIEVEKSYILKLLKEVIYNTHVLYDNKVYNLCKGLAQGLMLSSKLCDIYYAHMQKKYFHVYENAGNLFTYVDDSIYITKDEVHANGYLEKVKKGIPEYNCWFNKSKLSHNLNVVKNEENRRPIKYLGWKIDPCSLEVQPNYKSARYSISFTSLTSFTLEFKLQRSASLKLNRLVLSKVVNSEYQIFNNIKIIADHQAEKCFALLSCLIIKDHKLPIKIICKTNSKIMRKIETLTDWNGNEKTNNRPRLKFLMWKSFYNVFIKKSTDFLYLIKIFKKLMNKYQHRY